MKNTLENLYLAADVVVVIFLQAVALTQYPITSFEFAILSGVSWIITRKIIK